MSRATNDLFDQLHSLLAGTLLDELIAARKRAEPDADGNPGDPISPQLLDKIMKFLKDNGIDAPASNKPVNDLAQTLGALDLEDEANSPYIN